MHASLNQNDKSWFSFCSSLNKVPSPILDTYFKEWNSFLHLFSNDSRAFFSKAYKGLPVDKSISKIGLTNIFQTLFWPYRLDIGLMNQKLALFGMTGKIVKTNQKTEFYRALESIQTIQIPVEESRVVYSFNHPDLVEGMNRSGLLENSEEYVNTKKHLFKANEIHDITKTVD